MDTGEGREQDALALPAWMQWGRAGCVLCLHGCRYERAGCVSFAVANLESPNNASCALIDAFLAATLTIQLVLTGPSSNERRFKP